MTMPTATPLSQRQFGMLCATTLVAIAPHIARLPLHLSLSLGVLLVGRWFQRTHYPKKVSVWIKLPLTVLLPTMIIAHFGNLFGREPGSALACAMLVLKLFESERARDVRAGVTFSCFVLMSAVLFSQSLYFTLFLASSLILFLATLAELQPEPTASSIAEPQPTPPLRVSFRGAALSLLAAVPLTAAVFLFVPRLASPLWGAPGRDSSAHTGVGDRMAPGSIKELLIDDSPAFRVRFDGAPPAAAQRYWRGLVLPDFDGSTWSRPEWNIGQPPPAIERASHEIGYEITLEPTHQHWLYALDAPLHEPDGSQRARDLTLTRREPIAELLRYRATSALVYVLDLNLSTRDRQRNLRLPPDFNPRSIALAGQWRSRSADDQQVINAALNWFNEKFIYTLSPPELAENTVDDFLFGTQKGFCEHFSSAFTFLMRAAGIPARVVVGYQGGYYNDMSEYMIVRQSDAHAWSEVWLKDRGWLRIDPTAAVNPVRIERGATAANGDGSALYGQSWMMQLRNRFDLANRLWNDVILQFSALRQASLLKPLGIERADYQDLAWVLVICVGLLGAVATWWAMHRPRRRYDPLDQAYATFCRKLARAGMLRDAGEGPRDFAQRAARHLPQLAPAIQRIANRYIALRYATATPREIGVRELMLNVRRFRARISATTRY